MTAIPIPFSHAGAARFLLRTLFVLSFVVQQSAGLSANHPQQTSPTVDAQINAIRYDESRNLYTLSISLSEPGLIDRLILKIEEAEAGKQVVEEFFNVGGRSTIVTEIDGRAFVDEREYLIQLEGVDYAGFLIQRPDENNTLQPDERTTLTTKTFKHALPKAKPLQVAIVNVNVDFGRQLMLIDLDINDEDAFQINRFEGWVLDKETGARIYEFSPTLFETKRLQQTLPAPIATATAAREYELTLLFTTKDDQTIRAEPRTFKPIPPPPPGFFARLQTGLNHNPTLLTTMLIIVILVVGWLVVQNSQGRRDARLPPRPPITGTTVTEITKPRIGLRISVLQTPHAGDQVSKTVYHFPCEIGRGGCQVNIPHDTHMSRRHARITLKNGHFYLTDLESTNGTFVDHEQLTPKQPLRVNELSTIRLGKSTLIKLEPTD
ncbi:MAG: FHA domain-containing protein [Caldilineaceae bacterium]|nr:FHA domain-containing protein [Caldilineaceae bacterium]